MLEKLGKQTFVIKGHNNIGLYITNDNEAIIIDSGINDESGQLIMSICKDNNWIISMIINTHSHNDHTGGNYIIENTLNTNVYSKGIEKVLIQYPIILGSIAYGGYPHKYLFNKHIVAEASNAKEVNIDKLPPGIEIIKLNGHNADMFGIKTSDDVYFLADAIAGEDVINKYRLQFNYNVEEYLKTLDYISNLKGTFVPGHGLVFTDSKAVAELNKEAVIEVIDNLKKILINPISFDNIIKEIFYKYNLNINIIQYTYISSTIKCYLSYMVNTNLVDIKFEDNVMLWQLSK